MKFMGEKAGITRPCSHGMPVSPYDGPPVPRPLQVLRTTSHMHALDQLIWYGKPHQPSSFLSIENDIFSYFHHLCNFLDTSNACGVYKFLHTLNGATRDETIFNF